jgi:hypothetical protein
MGCIAVLLCFAETAFIDLRTETDAADSSGLNSHRCSDGGRSQQMLKDPTEQTDTVTDTLRTARHESAGCPACKSADTVRLDETIERVSHYCFPCRRGFDTITASAEPPAARRQDNSRFGHPGMRRSFLRES